MDKSDKQGVRKPYSSPELIVYGTVEDLTRNVGVMGNADGGGPPNQMTSP